MRGSVCGVLISVLRSPAPAGGCAARSRLERPPLLPLIPLRRLFLPLLDFPLRKPVIPPELLRLQRPGLDELLHTRASHPQVFGCLIGSHPFFFHPIGFPATCGIPLLKSNLLLTY